MTNEATLKGWQVILLRQPHQSHALESLITAMEGQCVIIPTVNIVALSLSDQEIEAGCLKIQNANQMLVVSQNAIHCAPPVWLDVITRSPLKLITMGQSTTQACLDRNMVVHFTAAPGTTSEILLSLPVLQANEVVDQNILILAGEGGRDVLANTLRKRGAYVDYLLTYRQEKQIRDIEKKMISWQASSPCIFSAFSSRSLEYFLMDLSTWQRAWVMTQPLIVMSDRIAAQAKEWGFKHIIVTRSALSEDMKSALHHAVQICDT